MKTFYVTFGQVHAHAIAGKTFDRDCVASIVAKDEGEARKMAFEYFDDKWCFMYSDLEKVGLHYYPRGIIAL